MKITIERLGIKVDYKPCKINKIRLKAGLKQLYKSLAEDEKKRLSEPSSLPKDWRSRILRDN